MYFTYSTMDFVSFLFVPACFLTFSLVFSFFLSFSLSLFQSLKTAYVFCSLKLMDIASCSCFCSCFRFVLIGWSSGPSRMERRRWCRLDVRHWWSSSRRGVSGYETIKGGPRKLFPGARSRIKQSGSYRRSEGSQIGYSGVKANTWNSIWSNRHTENMRGS